jgi:multiple sugar transport system permease protein
MTQPRTGSRGQWWRFALIAVITAIALVPIGAVVLEALKPGLGSNVTSTFTLQNFTEVFTQTDVLTWLRNSIMVTTVTMLLREL